MPYHCPDCTKRTRCDACKARRAARGRELRAKYRAAGLCIFCGDQPYAPGATRCAHHAELNASHSLASHRRTDH